MRDVQSEPDVRNVPIDKVGISGLSWPIQVLDRAQGTQETVAFLHHFQATIAENGFAGLGMFLENRKNQFLLAQTVGVFNTRRSGHVNQMADMLGLEFREMHRCDVRENKYSAVIRTMPVHQENRTEMGC